MKCYLAAPFFNELEIRVVRETEETLSKISGLTVHSPSRDGVIVDNSVPGSAQKAFDQNLVEMNQADLMVVQPYKYFPSPLTDLATIVPDSGSIWEWGYFFRAHKPIIAYTPNGSANLMLAKSSIAWVFNQDDLTSVVKLVIEAYSGNMTDLAKGLIEIKSKYGYQGQIY